ncbi:MAG TPA: citryl-CoA lyase [Rhizobiales bacterium]|nr:citrate synthase 1 [bacterium BMS3Bbin10]HDO52283.1 citryl-CoA lyase [Hyphomicrobiales bacterium]
MPKSQDPTTALCRHTLTSIHYRDKNLVEDLLQGDADFVKVMAEHILARELSGAEIRIVNAILIAIMEHGLTPSAIACREIYMSAPENLQGAVAAGLMGVGSQFVGTIENNAVLLARIVAVAEGNARRETAREIIAEHRAAKTLLPGFGHHLHKPDDPRARRLIEMGREAGFADGYLDSLELLSEEIDAAFGKHVPVNATGAVSALMGEMNIPVKLMRGFAVISRAAGLVAHIAEEQQRPSGRYIWDLVDRSVPYRK